MNQFFKETSGDKKIRIATSVTVIVLALCAGILSYDALRNLAVQAGIPPLLAILFPITIDGLILSGSLLMLFFANKGKRSAYGFFLTALGVVSSVAGNVAVSVDTLVSQLVHATSPVVLFLSIEALTILLRWRSRMAAEAAEAEVAAAAADAQAEAEVAAKSAAVESSLQANAPVALIPQTSDSSGHQAPTRVSTAGANHAPSPAQPATPVVEPLTAQQPLISPPVPPQSAETPSLGSWAQSAPSEPQAEVPAHAALKTKDADVFFSTAPKKEDGPGSNEAPSEEEGKSQPSYEPQDASSARHALPAATTLSSVPSKPAKPSSGGPTLREQINTILDANPNATLDYVSDGLEGDRKYVRKIAREEMRKRGAAA